MNRLSIHIPALMANLFVAMIVSSCNNEVFIASDELPEVKNICLDGNGDQWSSVFSRKGLTRISINVENSSYDSGYLKYYGANGKVVDSSCPPSELTEIDYETPLRYFSIGFADRMIYINSHYNISSETTVRLCLEYDYGIIKTINITLKEGKQVEMMFWNPEGEPTIEDNFEKIPHKTSLVNNSSITQKLNVDPFGESSCSDLAMPADSWAMGLVFDMPMPTFNGYEWVWQESESICLGQRKTFSPTIYGHDTLTVEVPPYTTATVTYTINYSRYTHEGSIQLYNPVLEIPFYEEMVCTAVYATSYDFTIDYE